MATTVVAVGSSPGKVTLQSVADIKVSVNGSCLRVSGPRQTLPAVLYPRREHTATSSHLAQNTLSRKKILSFFLPLFLSTLQGCYPIVCQRHISRSRKFDSMLLGNINKYALSHQRRHTMRQSWRRSLRLIQPQLWFLWSYVRGLPFLPINN